MLELAKVTQLLQEEENKLSNLFNKKNSTNDYLIEIYQKSECLNLQEIQNHKDYLVQISVKIQNQENVLKQITALVAEKQKQVHEALKEKNILEKLKEKQSEKHYLEIVQKEMSELDDISISRYRAL